MRGLQELRRILQRIDGRGYKAYREIQGGYGGESVEVHIDHVQADPFAPPSKIRVRVPGRLAGIPEDLLSNPVRRMAMEDFLARQARRAIRSESRGSRGSGKSGVITVDAGRQEVLRRTATVLDPAWVELRLRAGLPAAGRRILGRQAEEVLCREIPRIAQAALCWSRLPQARARNHVACIENQEHIRNALEARNLVAFVADGAILPRESGASDLPLDPDKAVPFRSPERLRVTLEVPNPIPPSNSKTISGMGIPRGVTLIVGGGYHGKTTLLRALERGVYPHIPGDGREGVVTIRDAVKIRAEDGRRVERVDISPFIADLPYGRGTSEFSTDDASGSTSQAANIVEALEIGARLLLLDEDSSATNFMIRDARMQALVRKSQEPITPFIDRVRELHDRLGVSTILVIGGCGDYFDVADTVLRMVEFLPQDATEEARRVSEAFGSRRKPEIPAPLQAPTERIPVPESFDPARGRREVQIEAKGLDRIQFGTETIDLRGIEQLVDVSQTRAVGHAIHLAVTRFMDGRTTLREAMDAVDRLLDEQGLDLLDPFHRPGRHPGDYARPRKYEIAAAINRLRTVRMRPRRRERSRCPPSPGIPGHKNC